MPLILDGPPSAGPPLFDGLLDEEVQRLGRSEVVVRDGVLGPEQANELRVMSLALEPTLTPAAVGRGAGRLVDDALRGDLTRWIERGRPGFEPFWRLVDRLGADLQEKAWLGVAEIEVQLAFYPGDGARYVPHHDAFAGCGRRRVTAVYYLNAAWRPGDGGELRVVTPAGEASIEPLLDRLVVYLSEMVEHEVLATHVPRWALTAWFLGPEGIA